jgi:CubicO group peptidase (beta-lactamase class C family)
MSKAAQIDTALRRAVEAGEVPGVVAMAATLDGPIYKGGFGERALGAGPAMSLDTVFRIASMTKAITSVATMQLVEQGKLSLDGPVPDIDPALARPQVLDGFDASGAPRLRPAKRPITLKHLLTHTAGFVYEMWNANAKRYVDATDTPPVMSGRLAALRRPLAFDPGDRWEYGINIDWAGRLVEAASARSACRIPALCPLPSSSGGAPASTSATPMAALWPSPCRRSRRRNSSPAAADSPRPRGIISPFCRCFSMAAP